MANFYPNLYNPSQIAAILFRMVPSAPTSPGLGTSPNPILAGYQFYLNGIGIPGTNREFPRVWWITTGLHSVRVLALPMT